MRIQIISFTEKGAILSVRLKDALFMHDIELVYKGSADVSGLPLCETKLSSICRQAFDDRTALIFVGAMGIAVRSIAPYVKDKLLDPPVIVIDEAGQFVIPVLSGHIGGANELAASIAECINAVPVLTTATDVSRAFPADMFAKENGLRIINRDGISKVASSSLDGRPVTISIKDYPPSEPVDVLISDSDDKQIRSSLRLSPRKYVLGIGCRRGKDPSEIRSFARQILRDNDIDESDIGAVATIDLKQDEKGIIELSRYWRVPLLTFEASVLARVQGEFTSSEFVKDKVGVDNVCERAAVLAAGSGSELAVRKQASNGMTIAIAKRRVK